MSDSTIAQYVCKICSTPSMPLQNFIEHILGKKHIKRYSNYYSNLKKDCTLAIFGPSKLQRHTVRILSYFLDKLKCIVQHAVFHAKVGFVVFENKEFAAEAIKNTVIIDGIKFNLEYYNKKDKQQDEKEQHNKDVPDLSPAVTTAISKIETQSLNKICYLMVRDLGLESNDYAKREKMRHTVECVLQEIFHESRVFLFGSSANQLGFKGCDVDMVVDLGYNIWEDHSLTDSQCADYAAKVTKSIAKHFKKKKFGYKIISIPRARVPLVKFIYPNSQLEVDLSFKNGMPIFNSRLIHVYCGAHSLVHPYMMLLRYWGKVHDIVGSAKPDTHLTSYSFSMMMLFWLMNRRKPIIPCVGELQSDFLQRNGLEYVRIINGWNCSFSEDLSYFAQINHKESIIELMREFFDFYSQLEYSVWVISPLQGNLVKREDLKRHRPSTPQKHLSIFYEYKLNLKLNTPLCVQDPFELSNNICPGFKESRLKLFQMKCSIASERCKEILAGEHPIQHLFDDYPVNIKDALSSSSKINITDLEIIDMDISSETSDDSVELLQEIESINRGGGIDSVMSKSYSGDSKDFVEIIEEKPKNLIVDAPLNVDAKDCDEIIVLLNNCPSVNANHSRVFIFEFEFKCHRPFEVLPDGKLIVNEKKNLLEIDTEKSLFSLLDFMLKYLFLWDIKEIPIQNEEIQQLNEEMSHNESLNNSVKRSADESSNIEDSSLSYKRHKTSNVTHQKQTSECTTTHKSCLKKYMCKSSFKFWVSRKQFSKTLLKTESTLLQRELAISHLIADDRKADNHSYWNQAFILELFRESSSETTSSKFSLEFKVPSFKELTVKERKNVSHNFSCILIWMKNFFKEMTTIL